MKSVARSWAIGEVAEGFGVETHVLRHWEDMGLVRPARDGADRRRYEREDLVRIAAVILSKQAGMSLDQIRVLLTSAGRGRRTVLQGHLDELDRRIAEIEVARELTAHAVSCRAHDIARCPQFQAHVADLVGAVEGAPT